MLYERLNHVTVGEFHLYVVPEEPTHAMHSAATLAVPPATGAFIVSPPPSPPPGWIPGEDAPPVEGLTLSLVALALNDLSLNVDNNSRFTLFEGDAVPSIVIEDYDALAAGQDPYDSVRPRKIPMTQTVRPPLVDHLHTT